MTAAIDWTGPRVFRAHREPVAVATGVQRLKSAAAWYLPTREAEEVARAVATVIIGGEEPLVAARDAVAHRRRLPDVYGACWRDLDDAGADEVAVTQARAWGAWS